MKLIIKIILVTIIINLYSEDFEFDGSLQFNKPYLFVPLGCTCWQAQALRQHSLRDAAFPFDWLLTYDNEELIRCLDQKFHYFLEEPFFSRMSATALTNYYKFTFSHDWQDNGDNNQLELIKKKYIRRIERFKNIETYQGKVFFIRCFQTDREHKGEPGWNAQNALNLNAALKKNFPNLNFTLVIISCTDSTISEIGLLDGIKEYKVKNAADWGDYTPIYSDLLSEYRSNLPDSLLENPRV
jgi:hypothetical protein